MRFEGMGVPGAAWVEIQHIREKDGTPLAPENWRHKLFGRISLCWIAGGLKKRGAFFKGKVHMENGIPVEIDLDSARWTSTTDKQPIEVAPGIYDLETNTCIYRLRILSDKEAGAIDDVIEEFMMQEFCSRHIPVPSGSDEGIPVS